MSRRQYVFIVAILLVWLAWAAGWVVLAAIAAGLIGIAVVRVLEGDVDIDDVVGRFRGSSGPPKRP